MIHSTKTASHWQLKHIEDSTPQCGSVFYYKLNTMFDIYNNVLQRACHSAPIESKLQHPPPSPGHLNFLRLDRSNPGGGYSLIWAMWGRAAGQGMVFGLAVLNSVYNLTCLCPKQGMVLRAERL